MQDVPYVHDLTLIVWVLVLVFYLGPIVCVKHFGESFFASYLRLMFVQCIVGVAFPVVLCRFLDANERKEFLWEKYQLGTRNKKAGQGGKEGEENGVFDARSIKTI
eukprot:TRINITY_DN14319_c1_g1_i4.p6 TRINITY_DN14319_c1_g1~~TRINITY_DN14319_c1_g1_i4.p6  ORF type:complete len:119 (+),score=15.27 TRINITY_DN14319_c1_g1_i4:42-359(+)